MPDTLNDFIEKKVRELWPHFDGDADAIEAVKSALRECAEETVEATSPQLDDGIDELSVREAQRRWLGTNDQPMPPNDTPHIKRFGDWAGEYGANADGVSDQVRLFARVHTAERMLDDLAEHIENTSNYSAAVARGYAEVLDRLKRLEDQPICRCIHCENLRPASKNDDHE